MKKTENISGNVFASLLDRRAFLRGAAAVSALGTPLARAAQAIRPIQPSQPIQPGQSIPDTTALKQAAARLHKILGMYTVQHEVLFDPQAAAIIANTFSLVADGNDLKFSNRLRPTPTTFDFTAGDAMVHWAEQHHLLFRGHCLIWWNALPSWFQSYVTPANAKEVMTNHIETVVRHYAGRVYSWDVVNECIYHDGRPDGLRKKPWLDLMGPSYIEQAFVTAHQFDPKAKLVLNECYIEHNTPTEQQRRAQLLALVTELKKNNVPVTHVGVQGHLRGNTPLDGPGMQTFCKQLHDIGVQVMVTELDVDNIDVPAAQAEQAVASKYSQFIEIMGPFCEVITFEGLRDNPEYPKTADGRMLRPNLFNTAYQPDVMYAAVTGALNRLRS